VVVTVDDCEQTALRAYEDEAAKLYSGAVALLRTVPGEVIALRVQGGQLATVAQDMSVRAAAFEAAAKHRALGAARFAAPSPSLLAGGGLVNAPGGRAAALPAGRRKAFYGRTTRKHHGKPAWKQAGR
jgi:hypothetical protein